MNCPPNTDLTQLIERFERDIIYDCHSLPTKYRRSEARRELVRLAKASVGPIAQRLRAPEKVNPYPAIQDSLKRAYRQMLLDIKAQIDPDSAKPESLEDWIAWAERMTAQS